MWAGSSPACYTLHVTRYTLHATRCACDGEQSRAAGRLGSRTAGRPQVLTAWGLGARKADGLQLLLAERARLRGLRAARRRLRPRRRGRAHERGKEAQCCAL